MNVCLEMHRAVRALMDSCAPSDGVVDRVAWDRAGFPSLWSAEAKPCIRPLAERRIQTKTLEQRMAENDWAFASTPGGVESLEASHSAAEILYLWGDLSRLSLANRQAWVDYFNRYQNRETGYFEGPYIPLAGHEIWKRPQTSHPWAHMHDHLLSVIVPCQIMLGGRPRHPLSEGSQTGRFLDRGYLENFLERDWTGYRHDSDYSRHNPWWMGNEFWYPGCILWAISLTEPDTAAGARARQLLDQVWFRWHDEHLNPFGFWHGSLAGDPATLWRGGLGAGEAIPHRLPTTPGQWHWAAMQVMGGAHQLWLYDFERHPIPDATRRLQTDLLLGMQCKRDGRFGLEGPDTERSESNDCTDVDTLTLLAYNFVRQDYRRADIAGACGRAASSILANKLDAFGVLSSRPGEAWTHHAHSIETYSPGDAPNMHQQAFYLWAVLAAVSILERHEDPAVQAFIDHPWPTMPTHWLWVPGRQRYMTTERA